VYHQDFRNAVYKGHLLAWLSKHLAVPCPMMPSPMTATLRMAWYTDPPTLFASKYPPAEPGAL